MYGMKSVRVLNAMSRVAAARSLSGSAVRSDTLSMKQPLQSSSTVAESDSIYKNFLVPDSEKYKTLQQRQVYFTEHILEDMWTLTDKKDKTMFVNLRYLFVALAVVTYLFTHYRITRGKKKREGQVI